MSNALEVLEDRIAPAGLATFVDVDGDVVTVKSSVGTSLALQAAVTAAVGGDNLTPSQMQTLTLGSPFAGGAIKISVTGKASGGDGMVNVWAIDATGIDLASVEVRGDLASLTVGDAIAANGSVKTVSVQSIGVSGGAMDKGWLMAGGTGLFTVAGDVNGARLFWYNSADAGSITVGKIFIGGALKGGRGSKPG